MVHLSDCQLSFTICQLKQIDMQKVISSRIGYWALDMCKVALRRNSSRIITERPLTDKES